MNSESGPFCVFEECPQAALGDVMRGRYELRSEAVARAMRLNAENGRRIYILNGDAAVTATFPTL